VHRGNGRYFALPSGPQPHHIGVVVVGVYHVSAGLPGKLCQSPRLAGVTATPATDFRNRDTGLGQLSREWMRIWRLEQYGNVRSPTTRPGARGKRSDNRFDPAERGRSDHVEYRGALAFPGLNWTRAANQRSSSTLGRPSQLLRCCNRRYSGPGCIATGLERYRRFEARVRLSVDPITRRCAARR
jgi:hypothetical protein